jgi:hypothetical protein
MHLSDEGILTQLGYPATEANLSQLAMVKAHTPGFSKIQNHLIALADHLRPLGGYIAFSGSKPLLKIKIDPAKSPQKALETVTHWTQKYNVTLECAKEGETYYITGVA